MRRLPLLFLLACNDGKPGSTGSPGGSGSAAAAKDAGIHEPGAVDGGGDPVRAARCKRAVSHVMQLMEVAGETHEARPSADEQHVIDGVAQASIDACLNEGLSEAQLDCLLAAKDWAAYARVHDCAAIRDKRPSWIHIP